jgi:hypothetical protein
MFGRHFCEKEKTSLWGRATYVDPELLLVRLDARRSFRSLLQSRRLHLSVYHRKLLGTLLADGTKSRTTETRTPDTLQWDDPRVERRPGAAGLKKLSSR